MLRLIPVRLRFSLVFATAFAVAIALVSSLASAQTVPTVSPVTNAPYPDRILHYGTPQQQDLMTDSTRPAGLNPDGINYDDCINDMGLEYSVYLSGFSGQSLEVWVSTNADCTMDLSRGIGQAPQCWLVASTVINQAQATAYNFFVRVQDIVGSQQVVPDPAVYTPRDSSACQSQPTESAVTFTVFFVPISAGYIVSGASTYQQNITADLVGPSPPVGVSIADGDTLFVVNWTANSDADTAGYDVFIDPIPGSGNEASAATGTQTQFLDCPDATSSTTTNVLDADTAEAGDATVASTVDAGCHLVNVGPSSPTPGSTTCTSGVLQSANVQDGGAIVSVEDEAATETFDEAGNLISTTTTGNVGICTIPCQYLEGASCTYGQPVYTSINPPTLPSESNGSYTILGLTNFTHYNVVVAAVDASGNVGPPSPEVCDYPAPVNDFFKNYTDAGGTAGGGFCALEAVGMAGGSSAAFAGAAAGAFVLLRYRRKRRRS
jgi:hypothetical protein